MSESEPSAGRAGERDLAPRVRPVQQRAKQTLDVILDTAGGLLEEVGIDAFNTNLLADRAGVAVRSVYRYYPNKLAVIVGLAERQADEWQQALGKLLAEMKLSGGSVLDAWERVLESYVTYIEGKPGRSAIRRAMQALPELRGINRADNDHISQQIAAALQARGVELGEKQLRIIGLMLLETGDAVFDAALSHHGRVLETVLEEVKRMHRSYLVSYIA